MASTLKMDSQLVEPCVFISSCSVRHVWAAASAPGMLHSIATTVILMKVSGKPGSSTSVVQLVAPWPKAPGHSVPCPHTLCKVDLGRDLGILWVQVIRWSLGIVRGQVTRWGLFILRGQVILSRGDGVRHLRIFRSFQLLMDNAQLRLGLLLLGIPASSCWLQFTLLFFQRFLLRHHIVGVVEELDATMKQRQLLSNAVFRQSISNWRSEGTQRSPPPSPEICSLTPTTLCGKSQNGPSHLSPSLVPISTSGWAKSPVEHQVGEDVHSSGRQTPWRQLHILPTKLRQGERATCNSRQLEAFPIQDVVHYTSPWVSNTCFGVRSTK